MAALMHRNRNSRQLLTNRGRRSSRLRIIKKGHNNNNSKVLHMCRRGLRSRNQWPPRWRLRSLRNPK